MEPFAKRRLEEASKLVADRYSLAPRTARRYVGAFGDALFRLRGRRLAIGGKGAPLMFTEQDWQLYQLIHEGGAVDGPADVGPALGEHFRKLERLSGEGAELTELVLELRADLGRLAQHVMGDVVKAEVRTTDAGTVESRVNQMLTVMQEQQRQLASVLPLLTDVTGKVDRLAAEVDHLKEGMQLIAGVVLRDH